MSFASKELAELAKSHLLCVASELNKLDPSANATASVKEIDRWGRPEWIATFTSWDSSYSNIAMEMERTHLSQWRSKENGKMRMSLDSAYGVKGKSLPQRKDHSFDYAKAAEHLIQIRQARVEREAREATAHGNDKLATALRHKIGYGMGMDFRPSQYENGKIIVEVKKTMTIEQAEKLAAFLKVL